MTIVLYSRRNVGIIALSYLVAKGHTVKVISDDENVLWLAGTLGCEVVDIKTMGEFDLFICVHGNKVIDKKYLVTGKFVNVHPCLYKYRGANPIKRYIIGQDTEASVESQYMIEEVDAGEVICQEKFTTPICTRYETFYNIALPYYYKVLDRTLDVVCR